MKATAGWHSTDIMQWICAATDDPKKMDDIDKHDLTSVNDAV